ncbi:MAG: helix-turn-helix transcriptional regulator [Actinomycetota bacterium]
MSTGLIGRDAETELLARFLDALEEGPAVLLLEGEAGIGKSTLWTKAVDMALQRSYRVLSCRSAESERKLAFGGLGDLLDDVSSAAFDTLPAPQTRALDVALLRADAGSAPLESRAVSLGFLGVAKCLAEDTPLLVAVDDLQWLDAPSTRVLGFASRRCGQARIGVLASTRSEDPEGIPLNLDRAVSQERFFHQVVGPLDRDSLELLVRAHLGAFPRAVAHKLHEVSGGNPFFALEIARAMGRSGVNVTPGEPLPVPNALRMLVSDRLKQLSVDAQRSVVTVFALARPSVALVRDAMESDEGNEDAVSEAIEAGVLKLSGHRLDLVHPLLGTTAYSELSARNRRALHERLCGVVSDPDERARHLALAAEGPDPEVADALDLAARRARARGAPESAVDLSEMAQRLTPPNRPHDLRRRLMDAAIAYFEAGDAGRAGTVYEQALAHCSPGLERAEALQKLGMVRATTNGWRTAESLFEQAVAEAGGDASFRGASERGLAYAALFMGRFPDAESHARVAVDLAESAGDRAELAASLQSLAYLEFAQGRGIPRYLTERAVPLESWQWRTWVTRPSFVLALALKYSGDLDAARSIFEDLLRQTTEGGEEEAIPPLLFHLAELECWAGNWEVSERAARMSIETSVQMGTPFYESMGLYALGLIDAQRGRIDSARSRAAEGLRLAELTDNFTTALCNAWVLGFVELSLGHHSTALTHLAQLPKRAADAGIREPGMLRFLPDAVEALVAAKQLEEAEEILEPFERRAKQLRRIWAMAAGARCRGLVLAARKDLSSALEVLEKARDFPEAAVGPFDRARNILLLGSLYRRTKQKRKARDALEASCNMFDRLGASEWAKKSDAEMDRIGGRAPTPLDLTATEERVAGLAGTGLSNQEIAQALFMSVRTVEWNLSKIYRKLGVRSRAELASRRSAAPQAPSE